jgi:hypothetical protein
MEEPARPLKPRYDQLAECSGLFVDPANQALRVNPLQQIFREHLLAQSMIDNGLYDEGHFILIAPELNHLAQKAATAYAGQLREPKAGQVAFHNVSLETFVDAFAMAGEAEHALALHRRYCDFWLVDGELELNAPRPKKQKPAETPSVLAPKSRVPKRALRSSATD